MLRQSGTSIRPRQSRPTSFAAILLLCLVGSPVSASEPKPVALEAGQPAPFAGQLLSVNRVIKLGQKAERCEAVRKYDADRMAKLFAIDLELARTELAIEIERAGSREEALRRELERESAFSLWTHPIFVVPVTVFLTYAITRAAAELP